MARRRSLAIGIAFLLLLVCAAIGRGAETELDRYIARPDPEFAWKVAATIPGDGYTTFILDLTSQSWRTADEVDRPVWKHWLSIVRPDKLRPVASSAGKAPLTEPSPARGKGANAGAAASTAFLFVGGGSNRDPQPEKAPQRVVDLALGTGTVVAELGMVPNQPLVFADSKEEGRSEDNLIAYTRVRYMATRDPSWLVRLAMVKSGVRAMDAMQQFLASDEAGKLKIDHFVVAGGSKRGWTTWLVGVVDPRVVAIVPLVIDALNSQAITRHHWEAYGFFSSALNDYVRHKIFPDKIGTPEYAEVLAIEDPYNYRDRPRLRMPKFLINASGDQFFLPDNSQFYYAALPEEKHLRYVPNAKHNLEGSDARESLAAFYQVVLDGTPRPTFRWAKQKDGSLLVTLGQGRPSTATLWQATNPKARDFRVDTIGKAYTSSPLVQEELGVYHARVAPPAEGFTAFFVELTYPTGGRYPLKFTTEVSVVPEVLPFKWEDAKTK